MNRHAYCILAHNEPGIFYKLISLIDDPRNDIYVHIDKRTDIRAFQEAKCNFSHLFFIEKRLACNWGSLSIVKAEMLLFETALRNGPYAYYHLLSGVDLPLKPQESIHSFLDENPGRNFIGFNHEKDDTDSAFTRFYHLLVYRPFGTPWQRFCNWIDRNSVKVQRKLGVRVHFPFRVYKGAQWVSLSHPFMEWLLGQQRQLFRLFRYTFIPDERVIQSCFMASPFADTLYRPDDNEFDQCMREIDWVRGSPYTWKDEDFDYLMKSDRWFARKFSSENIGIIDRIYTHIKGSDI